MSNWFLVTSAVNTEYGPFSCESRFDQTIGTIDSIKHYCPDAKIALIEGGAIPLTEKQIDVFQKKCDVIAPYNTHPTIEFIRKISGDDVFLLKTPSELFMLAEFLAKQDFIKPTDRVFKLSGRYFLNSNFNLNKHNHPRKLVFLTKKPNVVYFDPKKDTICPQIADWQYKCRLYSFCGSMTDFMMHKYREMFKYVFEYLYQADTFSDAEHLLYGFLGEEIVEQIEPMGVSGMFGDSGLMASE